MNTPEKLVIKDFSKGAHFDNFRITADGSLRKREGYELLHTFDEAIRGAISVRENKGEVIYVVAGKTLYKITEENGLTVTTCGSLTYMTFSSSSDQVDMFMFAGYLYILGGNNYYKWDGSSLTVVDGYIPLIRRHASATSPGVEYERPNLLTSRVRMRFKPDGTSMRYKLYGIASSIEQVFIGNATYNSASLYNTDSASYIEFLTPLESRSSDTIEVYYTLADFTRRSEITSCRHSAVYGGDTDSRVFLYGGNRPSVIYPSEPQDAYTMQSLSAEYFPMGGEITVGDGNLYVSGAVRQFDRLAIFTEDGAFYTYPREDSPVEGIPRFSFPILPLNSDVGASKEGGAVLVENEPFALNENGLFRFKSTTVRDERLAILEEAPDFIGLTREFIEGCTLYVNRLRGELWCCGHGDHSGMIAIYNARLDVWYRFTGISPDIMFTYHSDPAFCIGTKLYRFKEDILTDNGTPFEAIYESGGLDLGGAFDNKTLYEFAISIERVPGAKIDCILISDKGETLILPFSIPTTAPIVNTPSVVRSHARLSHASYIAFRLISSSEGPPSEIHEVMLRYRSV